MPSHPLMQSMAVPLPENPACRPSMRAVHGRSARQKPDHAPVSFEISGTLEDTSRFIDALRIPYIASSLGGVESLIEQTALLVYHDSSPEERAAPGMKDNLVRFSIGIEDSGDILADLEQTLAVL